MPGKLMERLPWPSVSNYISFSVITLGLALFHANRTVTQSSTKMNVGVGNSSSENISNITKDLPPELINLIIKYSSDEHFEKMLSVMRSGTWSGLVSHYVACSVGLFFVTVYVKVKH